MKNVKIYTLEDPETGLIKYVGKTIQKIERRLSRHLSRARVSRSSKVECWIYSLLKKGKEPVIKILDVVDENGWEFWEKFWIEQIKAWGFDIKNITPGGDGMFKGYIVTEETKEKIRNSTLGEKHHMFGKKHKKESVEKMRKAKIGKKNPHKGKKNEEIYGEVRASIIRDKKNKKIGQYDLANNLIKEWNSLEEASKLLKIHKSNISYVANGKRKTAGKFIWKFL